MAMIFYLTLLLLFAFGESNEANMLREENLENDEKLEREDEVAFESFGSPIYGANNLINPGLPFNGNSAYSYPIPPGSSLQGLPANYLAYLASMGMGSPYAYGPYSRYGILPYTSSLYGYGSPLVGSFSSNLLPGFAGYGSPYFGRSVYPGGYPGYPGYPSGLGYRYGAFAYPAPAGVKAGSATLSGAPAVGVPFPIPRSPASVASVPAPVPGVPAPVAGAPAPVAPYPAGFPVPFNGIPPYRPVVRTVQSKDGTVRYATTNV